MTGVSGIVTYTYDAAQGRFRKERVRRPEEETRDGPPAMAARVTLTYAPAPVEGLDPLPDA